MAVINRDIALSLVLAQEGGFVDHPRDPGGATKYGITQATLAAARGRAVTKSDVKALEVEEAKGIYRRLYWQPIQGDGLPAGIDVATFDFAVNSGPTRAAKVLQEILKVAQDGSIGPRTLAAAKAAHPGEVTRALTKARLAFLRRLPAHALFGRGWEKRVLTIEAQALRRVRAAAA